MGLEIEGRWCEYRGVPVEVEEVQVFGRQVKQQGPSQSMTYLVSVNQRPLRSVTQNRRRGIFTRSNRRQAQLIIGNILRFSDSRVT